MAEGEKVGRRGFLSTAAGVVGGLVIGGLAGYFAGGAGQAAETITKTITAAEAAQTVTVTETKTITAGAPMGKITIPTLFDLTGPTSVVGVEYADGVNNAVKWINEREGGIPGVGEIELVFTDYGYKPPEAISTYDRYKSQYNPPLILGWGTPDTEALAPKVAEDKIVYISASYSAHLNDPSKTPYNFYPVASYSEQARAAVLWMARWWEKEGENRPARLALAYQFGHPYTTAPNEAIKEYAKELGIEIVTEQDVSLRATDTSSQALAIKQAKADFVWFGNTVGSAAVFAKDLKKQDVGAILISNQWGHDENLITLAGEAAEGVHGASGHYYFGMESEAPSLINPIKKSIELFGRTFGPEDRFPSSTYIRGWLNLRMAAIGIMHAKAKFGEVTGENIKKAIEMWRFQSIEGNVSPPSTFTDKDHRPTTTAYIMKIENGSYKLVEVVTVERRPEWLGW